MAKVNVSRAGRFVPEWEGNQDLPDSEQLTVDYTHLSHDERQKFIRREKPLYILEDIDTKNDEEIDKEVTDQHARIEIKVDTDDEGILKAMAPRINNLFDTDDNPIDTWAKLTACVQTPENKLLSLIGEITKMLSGDAREKSTKK